LAAAVLEALPVVQEDRTETILYLVQLHQLEVVALALVVEGLQPEILADLAAAEAVTDCKELAVLERPGKEITAEVVFPSMTLVAEAAELQRLDLAQHQMMVALLEMAAPHLTETHTLEVVGAVLVHQLLREELEDLEAEEGAQDLPVCLWLEPPIQEAAEAVVAERADLKMALRVVLALSLFVIQTRTRPQHQPPALQRLPYLVGFAHIVGPALAQSHSKVINGAFCTA
jgi:hypothetical protein